MSDVVTLTPRRWLNNAEAAAYLGCSLNFLDRDRIEKLHGIPFYRLGRHIRYDANDLDAFILSGRMVASPKSSKSVPEPTPAALEATEAAVMEELPAADEANPPKAAVEQRRMKPALKRLGRSVGTKNKTLQQKEVTV